MADTAGPQTPTKKLFKASSKTPPVRRQHNLTKTPQSAPSSIKSSSPSPALFGKSSKISTPKRKVSLPAPISPSKPSSDDILKSTCLAPFTSKLDVDGDKIPDAASDTTGDTPVGWIDNDVHAPTDMASRSNGASKALSRESSETMAGAAGGSASRDSTEPGSLDEKFETVTDAPAQATEPKETLEQATDKSASVDDVAPATPSKPTEDQQSDAASSTEDTNDPIDLAQYFLDVGNPEMSKFVKALIGQDNEDVSAPTASGAFESVEDSAQNTAQKFRHTISSSSQNSKEESENPSADSSDQSKETPFKDISEDQHQKPSLGKESSEQSEDPSASKDDPEDQSTNSNDRTDKPSTEDYSAERSEKPSPIPRDDLQDGIAKPLANDDCPEHTEKVPAKDDLTLKDGPGPKSTSDADVVTEDTQDAENEAVNTKSGVPGVSQSPVEKLPTSDNLVSKPTEENPIGESPEAEKQDTAEESLTLSEKPADTVSGFPGVSKDPVLELPNDDELVSQPASETTIAAEDPQHTSDTKESAEDSETVEKSDPAEELDTAETLKAVEESEFAEESKLAVESKPTESSEPVKASNPAEEPEPAREVEKTAENSQRATGAENTARSSQPATSKGTGTIGGFPNVSENPVEELPNDDELVAEPPSKTRSAVDNTDIFATDASETVDGFPDVSCDPVEELPTNDDLVIGAKDKVEASEESLQPASSGAQDKTKSTTGDMQGREEQPSPQTIADTQKAAEGSAGHNIGVPDTENITRGKHVTFESPGKALDVKDSISTPEKGPGDQATDPQDVSEEILAQRGSQTSSLPEEASNGDVVSKANKKPSSLKKTSTFSASAPDSSNSTQESEELADGSVRSAMVGGKDGLGAKAPRQLNASNTSNQPRGSTGGVQAEADNMGKPARINRRVDIPLPRPGNPNRSRSRMDMPEVDNLKTTDGLNNVNDLDDPPEEFLDPSVHTSPQRSANISPIPRIHDISPISSQPPPDLACLASGLGGFSVDDVGNIVDETGKVLGHATGDLPSMIGKKVANNGEIYGDRGELIGFVTENFTGHPPPPESPREDLKETPLPNGLKVDREGNILDNSGNIVGKLNRPSGASTKALAPLNGETKDEPKTQTDGEKEKPRAKFDEGSIPADIFLDVKSTPDGIQLTIRIPTIFKQETQQTTE
ncbi:hypothetical protein BKA67DRAFT_665020 [Truncatella angustata]|uniref:Uncharacterized protein n=1 Tax=Truncatella angustata TaxID=152316 RepID=A0A9P8RFQ8_9PEZI|nr:uncharacterized protein BKA67DRAFT_665020 [Truncatella angustata]KAH6645183.1 hypothetical protein BKA67DRAFT_665020 [Truncatella angustata]